ncbi:MAG: hypothetical protein LBQ44_03975 [Treponema sp.]|jgi:hypothetical protein|nr:hypothetical protein [Treponema sp.]
MNKKRAVFAGLLAFASCLFLSAQSHVSVPLHNEIYYVLEQAEMRGFCDPLPQIKPYSRKFILETVEHILGSGGEKLNTTEREILEKALDNFRRGEKGMDWERGKFSFEYRSPKRDILFTGDIGVGAQLAFSGGVFAETGEAVWGTDNLISAYHDADIGEHFSYRFHFLGHLTRAPREQMGNDYWTYYEGYVDDPDYPDAINRQIPAWSQPVAFFPYTYRKSWDGFVVQPNEIGADGLGSWPNNFAVGPMMLGELSGGFLDDMITWRFGRMRREWGAISGGQSLILNGAAHPFMGIEANFNPTYWFGFSAVTGVLEYFNRDGLKKSSRTFQNAFSAEMVEFNVKNRFHIDLGSTAVWSKRFELGYIFPPNNNFLYQDSVGDFDNMGFFLNLRGQQPGLGKVWFSFFADDIDPSLSLLKRFAELDRQTFAYQAGLKLVIPRLPFAAVSLSYTKIEPYTYTHNRIFVPWYSETYEGNPSPMETSYTNNGENLGYYLPPNSDELLLRLDVMPRRSTVAHVQYQLIRHGAEHGSGQVDGSSFLSELDPGGTNRANSTVLRKYFLHDGAYQWQHIFKVGAEHSPVRYPFLRFFGEAGVVFSHYSNIGTRPNSGRFDYSFINTDEYPISTEILCILGVRLFM